MKKISILFLAVFSLLFVAFTIPQAYSAPITGDVNLNVEVHEDESGKITGHGLSQYAYGSRVSISLEGLKQTRQKEFGFYLYKGQLIEDEEAEFLVTDSSKITVVLKETTEVVAAFVDSNGTLLGLKYGVGTFAPTLPDEVPTKPGFEFTGFGTVSSISEDTLFVAQYNRTKSDVINVTVTGGALVTGVTYNDVVTLEPTDAVSFKYWADADGQFVSSKPDYTFTALEDVEFVAVTEGVVPTLPSVYLSNVTGIRAGYKSFLGYLEFDETYELLEYGVLVSEEAKVLELGDPDVEKKPSTVLSPINEFLRSFDDNHQEYGTYSSFRAYAIFKQGTEQVVVYSDNNFYVQEDQSTTYIEGFDGIGNNNSYGTRTYEGVNGVEWVSTNTREDQTLTGKAFTPNDGILSATLTNGLTSLEFNYKKAFSDTGAAIKVYINGQQIGDTIAVANNTSITHKYSSGPLNYTGDVQLEIRVTKRITIDDITWSSSKGEPIHTKLYNVKYIDELNTNSIFVVENSVAVDQEASKEGYSFVGWFDESNEKFIFTTPITRHTTLTAVYNINQYILTFDTDGGTEVAPISGDYATAVSAPAAPTKVGYTFAGWSPALPETIPAGNQTYTATWTPNDYTITFDVDGGSAVAPLTQAYLSDLVMPAIPTKDGFNFVGWFTDVERIIPFEATTMPSENITLYALWQDANLSSTVTFEVNGGSEIAPVVVNNGEVVFEPTDPIKEGYTFVGWYTDGALELAYDFEALVETDFTLYAKWQINEYSISFDPNGGSGSIQVKSAVHGFALVEAERPTAPTRSNHTFVGWFDTNAASGGNEWVIGTVFTSVKTYYARWTAASQEYTFTIPTGTTIGSNTVNTDFTDKFTNIPNGMTIYGNKVALNTAGRFNIYQTTDSFLRIQYESGTIISIKITFGSTVAKTAIGTTIGTGSNPITTLITEFTPTANSTTDWINVNNNVVYIDNTNSTNTQIFINKIVVTYSPE